VEVSTGPGLLTLLSCYAFLTSPWLKSGFKVNEG
jgi:hypothetical protein